MKVVVELMTTFFIFSSHSRTNLTLFFPVFKTEAKRAAIAVIIACIFECSQKIQAFIEAHAVSLTSIFKSVTNIQQNARRRRMFYRTLWQPGFGQRVRKHPSNNKGCLLRDSPSFLVVSVIRVLCVLYRSSTLLMNNRIQQHL